MQLRLSVDSISAPHIRFAQVGRSLEVSRFFSRDFAEIFLRFCYLSIRKSPTWGSLLEVWVLAHGVHQFGIWPCNRPQQWPCCAFSLSVGRSREPTKKKSWGRKKNREVIFSVFLPISTNRKNPWKKFELCRFRSSRSLVCFLHTLHDLWSTFLVKFIYDIVGAFLGHFRFSFG